MTTNEPAEDAVSWRDLAVARSLDSARTRAENRVQRFLDAALELMNGAADGKEFTVQEVVERSGQSLRSFYQYFGGKHELLLALFEESVRTNTERLRAQIAEEDEPLERLHRFVVEYCRITRATARSKAKKEPAAVMVDFAQQLLTAHPAEASRAFAPVVSLFNEVLEEAAAAGVVRKGMHQGIVAGMVLEAILFNPFSATIGGPAAKGQLDPAEALWDLILNGIGAP